MASFFCVAINIYIVEDVLCKEGIIKNVFIIKKIKVRKFVKITDIITY